MSQRQRIPLIAFFSSLAFTVGSLLVVVWVDHGYFGFFFGGLVVTAAAWCFIPFSRKKRDLTDMDSGLRTNPAHPDLIRLTEAMREQPPQLKAVDSKEPSNDCISHFRSIGCL